MTTHKTDQADAQHGRKVSEQLREALSSLTIIGDNLDKSAVAELHKADARKYLASTASNLELAAQHMELGEKKLPKGTEANHGK